MPDLGDSLRCTSCQAEIPARSRFCLACGTPVADRSETEARKTVTLVFCDVSGSTALGEQLDPEAYRGVMSRYFDVARAAVERHGGTVEKFVGDAVLAVFGVPEVREDDALRAVRAAAELSASLRELSEELTRTMGVGLTVRTGVNTGSVVTGAARAGGSFATGDAVNTAARLEQAAGPGEVLIGAGTWAMVRDAVEVEPVAPLTVKGKTHPLPAFRLLRMLDVSLGRTRRLDADLVGREREMRALEDALARTTEAGRSHLVTVLGTAGVGKTRLVAQFLDELDQETRVLTGRCVSYGQGITYWPVVQVVREAAGLVGTEGPEATTQALLDLMAGHGEAKTVADRLLPLLVRDGEPGSAEETFWAVRSMLEHLAGQRPLLIAVDDLHWAEPTLLELLERLRDELRDLPLLLLCQARPELLEERPGWGGGALNSTTFLLEPFTGRQTGALLAGLLGPGVPEEIVVAVDGWAGGNPLFVEEVVAHLTEEGVLRQTSSGWEFDAGVAGMSIPPTVSALLAARLARLPSSERSLVERVSVIGLEFTADEARGLSEPHHDVAALLTSLGRRDLLRRAHENSSDSWVFRHILVREAAYESLPLAVRADLHERFGDRLAAGGRDTGGEIHAFVGHHLEQAVRYRRVLSAGTDDDALASRAARTLGRAAAHARDADDLAAARSLLERSLAIARGTGLRRELTWSLARVQYNQYEHFDALRTLRDLESLMDDSASPLERASLSAQLLVVRSTAGEEVTNEELLAASARAAELARADGDPGRLGAALECGYSAAMMRATWSDVERIAGEAVEVAEARDRRTALTHVIAAQFWGERPYAVALETVVALRARSGRSERDMVLDAAMEAGIRASLGQHAEARALWAESEQRLPVRDAFTEQVAAFALVHVFIAGDDGDGAQRLLKRAVDRSREAGSFAILSTLQGWRCALLLEYGDPDGELPEALAETARHTQPFDLVSASMLATCLAVTAARTGKHEEARTQMEASLGAIDQTDQLVQRGDARRWLSEVARGLGELAAERRMLGEAVELYRQKGNVPLAERAERMLDGLAQ
jgi:class 3 adenylate cyclase